MFVRHLRTFRIFGLFFFVTSIRLFSSSSSSFWCVRFGSISFDVTGWCVCCIHFIVFFFILNVLSSCWRLDLSSDINDDDDEEEEKKHRNEKNTINRRHLAIVGLNSKKKSHIRCYLSILQSVFSSFSFKPKIIRRVPKKKMSFISNIDEVNKKV